MAEFQVFRRPQRFARRSRKIAGHRVVKAESGGYRCKCGVPLAERITAARDMQRFHVTDVWMKQRAENSAENPNETSDDGAT